jgi:hypothetical protein
MNNETTNAIYNKKLEELTNANKNNDGTQEESKLPSGSESLSLNIE